MRENNRAARAARFLVQIFEVFTTSGPRRSKSLILCLYLKTILAKQKFNKDIAPLGKIVRHVLSSD